VVRYAWRRSGQRGYGRTPPARLISLSGSTCRTGLLACPGRALAGGNACPTVLALPVIGADRIFAGSLDRVGWRMA
jgi:hypothetical protein